MFCIKSELSSGKNEIIVRYSDHYNRISISPDIPARIFLYLLLLK